MPDFSLEAICARNWLKQKAVDCFKCYGFAPVETAAMERSEVLLDQYGVEGEKLIFHVLNTGDYLGAYRQKYPNTAALPGATELRSSISEKALRYDLTVPLARYVAAHAHELAFPFRRYQIQPVWRADRPQSGRFREFWQCDVDVVGSDSHFIEAEMLALAHDLLGKWGVKHFQILINHRALLALLATRYEVPLNAFQAFCRLIDINTRFSLDDFIDELKKIGTPSTQAVAFGHKVYDDGKGAYKRRYQTVAEMIESMKPTSQQETEVFDKLLDIEKKGKALCSDWSVRWFPLLARGLDYYTGTIFETYSQNENNEESGIGSLMGGGRYDNLVERFVNQSYSGVGMSFGLERVYTLLKGQNHSFSAIRPYSTCALIVCLDAESEEYTIDLLKKLRHKAIPAELYWDVGKLKKVFHYADKKKIPYVILVGSDEQAKGVYTLKRLSDGHQQVCDEAILFATLARA